MLTKQVKQLKDKVKNKVFSKIFWTVMNQTDIPTYNKIAKIKDNNTPIQIRRIICDEIYLPHNVNKEIIRIM